MKYLFSILIIIVLSLQGFSQRTNDLKIGLGQAIFLGNESGATGVNKINGLPTFFIEKPIAFTIDRDEKICLNPGIAVFYFHELEEWGDENAGGSKDLNNFSINGYVKLLFKQMIQRRSEAYIYFGGITGIHMYSNTSGEKIIFSQNVNNPSFEEAVNKTGKDFFNTIYYGVVAGFQPNAKITALIKPSFEFAFYPSFVSKEIEKVSAVQVSVLLGINL